MRGWGACSKKVDPESTFGLGETQTQCQAVVAADQTDEALLFK